MIMTSWGVVKQAGDCRRGNASRGDWSVFRRMRRFGEDALAENMDLSFSVTLCIFLATAGRLRGPVPCGGWSVFRLERLRFAEERWPKAWTWSASDSRAAWETRPVVPQLGTRRQGLFWPSVGRLVLRRRRTRKREERPHQTRYVGRQLTCPGTAEYYGCFSAPRRGRGQVAQLVEHGTENPGVGGSSPPLSTGF